MLQIRLYGVVRAHADGVELQMGSLKQRAVLALLALDAGRVVSADRLVDELWPDTPPASATSTLQVYLSRLRRMLAASGEAAVVRRRPGYVLEIPADRIDLPCAATLLDAGRAALERGDGDRALAALSEAAALTAAPPLQGLPDDTGPVLAGETARLRELDLAVREARTEALLAVGRAAAAAELGRAVVIEAPLRENAHALLMQALHRSGRAAEALEVYDQVRLRLADELGVDPGPALRRLHTQLLRQDPALDGPVAAGVVVADPPAAPPAAGQALVGRDAALATLDGVLEAARQGRGAVVVVDGEAGIGKTALATEVVRRAAASGLAVAWGRADEAAVDVPYWPWQPVLRALPDLARDGAVAVVLGTADLDRGGERDAPGPAARLRLLTEVAERLAALSAPTLVVLDDLQWADEASLALLVAVAERLAAAPLVVLGTHRTDIGDDRLLGPAARLARTPTARRIALTGLGADDLRTLLGPDVDDGTVRAVHQRTSGNPFFVTELVKAAAGHGGIVPDRLATEVPGSVRDVVLHRLQALPAGTRELLDTAAVAAPTADLDLVAAVSGLDAPTLDTALEAAVAAGLLTERLSPRPAVHFTHSLIREVLTAQLRPTVRARRHAEIARRLLQGAPSDDVVHHVLGGAAYLEPATVVTALVTAATTGLYRYEIGTVETVLRRAQAALDEQVGTSDGTCHHLAVGVMLGRTLAARRGWPSAGAQEAFGRAAGLALERLAAGADVDPGLLEAVAYGGTALVIAGRTAELEDFVARLRAAVASSTDPRTGVVAEVLAAEHDLLAAAPGPAAARLAAALPALAGEQERWAVLLRTFGGIARGLALAASPGDAARAVAATDDAVAVASAQSPQDRGAMLTWRAVVAAAVGDRAAATEAAAEALELCRAGGMTVYAAFAGVVRGWAAATDPTADPVARGTGTEEAVAAAAVHRDAGRHVVDAVLDRLLAEARAGVPTGGHPG